MKKKKGFIWKINFKKKRSSSKSFTLVELLVVIAIIGILSSIVYVSLDSAKARTKDKAVQAQLSSMKVQAEVYYINKNIPGTIHNICTHTVADFGFGGEDGLLKQTQQKTGIASVGPVTIIGTAGAWNQVTCHASTNGWAVEAPSSKSKEDSPRMYCIDSKGLVKEKISNLAAFSVTCPTT